MSSWANRGLLPVAIAKPKSRLKQLGRECVKQQGESYVRALYSIILPGGSDFIPPRTWSN